MNTGQTLFPAMMMALLAGCSPASNGRADASAPEQPGQAVTRPVARAAIRAGGKASPENHPADDHAPDGAAPDPAAVSRPAGAETVQPPAPAPVIHSSPASVPDLPPSQDAADPAPFPEEVTRYMVDRDGCDHFRGEEGYDAERRAYLQESVAELCTGTDARLAQLRKRYADDPAVTSALSAYEDRIEGNSAQ